MLGSEQIGEQAGGVSPARVGAGGCGGTTRLCTAREEYGVEFFFCYYIG